MKHLIIVLALFFSLSFATVNSETTAITSSNSSIAYISKAEVRLLYLMRTRKLDNGERITLFQMPSDSYEYKLFILHVLEMSVSNYNHEIDKINNSGMGVVIVTVKTREEMIYRVSNTMNSIGYIDSDYLLLYQKGDGIKMLKII